jgi:hypothetical protein
MTLPNERNRAVRNTRRFLYSLIIAQLTPRVPLKVRRMARQLLKHYPSDFEMDEVEKIAPKIFGKEDL